MKFGFDFADSAMPRTIFYARFCDALRSDPRFCADLAAADVVFPAEDTAIETNWPCYANRQSAFLRGSFELPRHVDYLKRLIATKRRLCITNMAPATGISISAAPYDNIVVADVNLRVWDRAANPRTVSMPALPFVVGGSRPVAKTIVASFRGIESHPCRRALATLHNGATILVELVPKENHFGKIDAEKGIIDEPYAALLAASLFAFVPRGDAEFSYRLLEVMSFGCIPIVVSDGLVLPFDRTVRWSDFSIHIPEQQIGHIPHLLTSIPRERARAMQRHVASTYAEYFSSMRAIVRTLLDEVEGIVSTSDAPTSPARSVQPP